VLYIFSQDKDISKVARYNCIKLWTCKKTMRLLVALSSAENGSILIWMARTMSPPFNKKVN